MDDFNKKLQNINKQNLKVYILALQFPCYENDLFKIVFPDSAISRSDPLALYQNHFLLFHLLYQLQDEFYREDKYLYVHFMRTSLADYPEKGECRYYDDYSGRFCSEKCTHEKNYCDFHQRQIGNTEIDELSARYFYMDIENYYRLNKETAEAFLSGTWEMLKNYDEYKKSFDILELPESADINMIKKKFKVLAKKYHPDHGEKSCDKFNEINRAYRMLIQLHPEKWGRD